MSLYSYLRDGVYYEYMSVPASTAVAHSPYINTTTNTWWQYDDELQRYVNTGVSVVSESNIEDILVQVMRTNNVITLEDIKALAQQNALSPIWNQLIQRGETL